MQTECSPTLFEFEPVERHKVVAGFDGGIITSDAGGLLLGRLDRGLGLIRRMASCFTDRRDPRLLEHTVETLVGQRVFALALGYEDLNDHDELRHDPLFHVLAGKLEAKRSDCAPVAGKSTVAPINPICRRNPSIPGLCRIASPTCARPFELSLPWSVRLSSAARRCILRTLPCDSSLPP